MNPGDTARLLGIAAAFDQRTVGKADVAAWYKVLEGVRYVDAEQAVLEHYSSTRDRLMPFDVLNGVKAIRSERVREHVRLHGGYVPSDNLDPERELEERRRWYESVADGLGTPKAIEGPR